MTLSAKCVHEIFDACLFQDEEVQGKTQIEMEEEATLVCGIMVNVGFCTERLDSYREEIVALLNELPEAFHEKTGGGMSFLQACVDRHGNRWAEHQTMEELFMLGLAIDRVSYCLPRELWSTLPGGVPYLTVKACDDAIETAANHRWRTGSLDMVKTK